MLNNVKQMNQAKHLSHQLSSGWRDTGSVLIRLAECVGRRSGGRGDAEVLCWLAFHWSTITDMEGNMIILFVRCDLRWTPCLSFLFLIALYFNEPTSLDLGQTRCWLALSFLKQLHLGMRIT